MIDFPLLVHHDAYADYLEHSPNPDWSRSEWTARRAELSRRLERIVTEGLPGPDAELRALAEPLQLFRPAQHDPRLKPTGLAPPSLDRIARVTTDRLPDAGDRPEHVLGPWSEELDLRQPGHADALLTALAVWCFAATGEQRTIHRWARHEPRPTVEERDSFRSVDFAPMALWGLEAREGERWHLTDLIGLGPGWVPEGAVVLHRPGAVAGPPRPGDTLCARIVPHEGGPTAMLGLVIPGRPPAATIAAWVELEMARLRLQLQRIRLEGMLRRRGHVLTRWAHCWAWSEANPPTRQ